MRVIIQRLLGTGVGVVNLLVNPVEYAITRMGWVVERATQGLKQLSQITSQSEKGKGVECLRATPIPSVLVVGHSAQPTLNPNPPPRLDVHLNPSPTADLI